MAQFEGKVAVVTGGSAVLAGHCPGVRAGGRARRRDVYPPA